MNKELKELMERIREFIPSRMAENRESLFPEIIHPFKKARLVVYKESMLLFKTQKLMDFVIHQTVSGEIESFDVFRVGWEGKWFRNSLQEALEFIYKEDLKRI